MNKFRNILLVGLSTFILSGCFGPTSDNIPPEDEPQSVDIHDEKEATLDKLNFELEGHYYSVTPKSKSIEGEVIIPSYYNNRMIHEIRDFVDCDKITSLTIYSKVAETEQEFRETEITAGTFKNCTSLESVIFADGDLSMDGDIFDDCSKLTSVVMPKSGNLHDGCQLRGVENIEKLTLSFLWQDSYATQGEYEWGLYRLFGGEPHSVPLSLEEITFTDDLKFLSDNALMMCRGLKKVNLPDNGFKMGNGVFMGCTALEEIDLPSHITSIPKETFQGCGSLKTINMKNPCTVIQDEAFAQCSSLEEFPLTDSCTKIGSRAFYGCESLKSIYIPNNELLQIGDCAFEACTSLEGTLSNNGYYLGNETNPYFYLLRVENKNVSSFTINPNCVYIGSNVFYEMSSLIDITIPESVNYIQSWALFGTGITEISLPKVYRMNDYVFGDCRSLKTVNISEYLLEYGYWLMSGCSSMKTINYNGTRNEWNWNIKKGSLSLPKSVNTRDMIHCTDGTRDADNEPEY